MFFHSLAIASPAPAGGAALDQVALATGFVTVLTAALLVLGLSHRSGRIATLDRLGAALGRHTGLPSWAALPSAVAAVSLITAAFGMYWDISLHIDQGRDPGPLANPAHYFILLGLYGILASGWLAIVLPRKDDPRSPAALRIAPDWHVPVAGVLLTACASFAMVGFPLDDVSHRLFGQDVTLWGPTHLMLLGGAALTLVGILVLVTEGRLATDRIAEAPAPSPLADRLRHSRTIGACGGLLIALSIFQGEFDFGVPQFRMLYHPLLIAFAASLALVAARTLIGRGGALATVAFYLVVRAILSALVGPVLGETTPHFPLYVAEAALVEGLALALRPGSFRFAAAAGALIATAGVAVEHLWSHVWMPLPWPAHLLPEAIALSLPIAIAGATIGTFVGNALQLRADRVARPRPLAAVVASVLVVGAIVGALLPMGTPRAGATFALRQLHGTPGRTVAATIRFEPASVVRDADALSVTAWQGGGHLVVDRLRRVGDGVYRTTKPIPVDGGWKAMVRYQRGRDVAAIPLRLPGDAAIPAPAVPARAHMTRAFQLDQHVLQRERKRDVPGWLWGVAGLVVLGATLTLLLILAWGLVRLARTGAGPSAASVSPRTAAVPRPGAVATSR